MSDAVVERLALIGAGLIGSSIARAARDFNAARSIVIYDAAPGVRARVREIGIADVVEDEDDSDIMDLV